MFLIIDRYVDVVYSHISIPLRGIDGLMSWVRIKKTDDSFVRRKGSTGTCFSKNVIDSYSRTTM